MLNNKEILSLVKTNEDYMINVRRYLHTNPELSQLEFETSKFLKSELQKFDIEIVDGVNTGFYAILKTNKPGSTIGFRADIDALPVIENEYNLKGKRKTISQSKGVMHACGHDGHMATVLTLAKILSEQRDNLSGTFIFIFEEAEENGMGISLMIESLKDVSFDFIYGTHLAAFLDTGKFGIDPNAIMAGAHRIDFDVFGRGGHGSRPDLAINPIFATSAILNNLAIAWSNQVDVSKTVTLGITEIKSGSTWNVIPDSSHVSGSLRFFDQEEGDRALKILKKVVIDSASTHNCTVEYTSNNHHLASPVINDLKYTSKVRELVNDIYPNSIKDNVTWFASESFNRYSELAPTVFAFVGCRNNDIGSGADHHNEYFDIDEESLSYSLTSMLKIAINI